MKPKLQPVLAQCLEVGIKRGWSRAHKYNDAPEEQTIFDEIQMAIEGEIYEWFDFEENGNE